MSSENKEVQGGPGPHGRPAPASERVQQIAGEDTNAHANARADRFRLTGEPDKHPHDVSDDPSPAEKQHGALGSSAAIQQHDAGQLDKGGHPGFNKTRSKK